MKGLIGKLLLGIKKRGILFLIPLLLFFTHCIREEIIDDFAEIRDAPAVVYSLLTPGDQIQVLLFRSAPFFDTLKYTKYDLLIYDADIRIFNDHGDTIRLSNPSPIPAQLDPYAGQYTASQDNFPIIAGETYHLQVNISDTELLSASTRVPAKATTWDTFEVYNKRAVERLQATGSSSKVLVTDSLVDIKGSWSNQGPETLLTGPFFNDASVTKVSECCKHAMIEDFRYYNGDQDNYNRTNFVIVTLSTELEDYQRVYDLYFEHETNVGFGLFLRFFNGVFSEYTNIEGGLGLFASHLTDEQSI